MKIKFEFHKLDMPTKININAWVLLQYQIATNTHKTFVIYKTKSVWEVYIPGEREKVGSSQENLPLVLEI